MHPRDPEKSIFYGPSRPISIVESMFRKGTSQEYKIKDTKLRFAVHPLELLET